MLFLHRYQVLELLMFMKGMVTVLMALLLSLTSGKEIFL